MADDISCEGKLEAIRKLHEQPAAVVGITAAVLAFEGTRKILGIQGAQSD